MGFVKDMHELDTGTKYLLVSMICIMPFWYIAIWIFDPVLFNKGSLYLIFALSFCFTLILYLLNLFLHQVILLVFNRGVPSASPNHELKLVGGLETILYFCIPFFYCYLSKLKYDYWHLHYCFIWFLRDVYIFTILRVILASLGAWAIAKFNKNENTAQVIK
jgi:hypothetical protein